MSRAMWDLTLSCPNRCRHCIAVDSRHVRRRVDQKTARSILRRLVAGGVDVISFKRGEPLLQPDLIDLVEEGNRRGTLFEILCGGRGVNKNKLRRLLALPSPNLIVFSLDDDREDENDRLRYRSSYRSVVRWLSFLKEVRLQHTSSLLVGVSHTVTRNNWRRVTHFLDLMRGYDIDIIEIGFVQKAGGAQNKHLDVSPKTKAAVVQRVKEGEGRYPFVIRCQARPPRRSPTRMLCTRGASLRVDSRGFVFPCSICIGDDHALRGIAWDEARAKAKSLADVSLKAALKGTVFNELRQRFRAANRLREEFRSCRRCAYRRQCRICPLVIERLVAQGRQHRMAPCRIPVTEV